MLHVALTHAIGTLRLDVSWTFGPGLTAIVGPSGAGKTTLLRLIAGVTRPSSGLIRLGDRVLVDTERRIWCPPHMRHIGYVAQAPHLFPHLSVRNNLRYAQWCAGRSRASGAAWTDVLALLDLAPLLGRSPRTLSGGEQQRVALGRALLASPHVLLLDEPLAAIDVERRNEILPYLDRLRASARLPMLYVTHTLAEIESRADALLRLEGGKVERVTAAAWPASPGV